MHEQRMSHLVLPSGSSTPCLHLIRACSFHVPTGCVEIYVLCVGGWVGVGICVYVCVCVCVCVFTEPGILKYLDCPPSVQFTAGPTGAVVLVCERQVHTHTHTHSALSLVCYANALEVSTKHTINMHVLAWHVCTYCVSA